MALLAFTYSLEASEARSTASKTSHQEPVECRNPSRRTVGAVLYLASLVQKARRSSHRLGADNRKETPIRAKVMFLLSSKEPSPATGKVSIDIFYRLKHVGCVT